MSPPARSTTRTRSRACWSSKSPRWCAGGRACCFSPRPASRRLSRLAPAGFWRAWPSGLSRRWPRAAAPDQRRPRTAGARLAVFELNGQKALVTGASGGIGAAIARTLHAQGAEVTLSGTRRPALIALAEELGAHAHVATADLALPEAADGLVAAAEAAMGRIDILVNNAGVVRDALALRIKDEDWQKVLDIDLTAAFRLTRAALRGMVRRRHGRVIAITSIVAFTGNAGQANYAAAKAALVGMSKSIAAEVAGRGVTVNCVAPGFVETAMTAALSDAQRDRLAAAIPAGRFGAAAEIAAAVAYLASAEAAYVTGQTLHVNGGMAML